MKYVCDYMTPTPITVEQETKLSKAITLMQQHNIRHLPVTKNSKLVGIVSDRDIKLILGMKTIDMDKWTVRWVYTPVPFKVSPKTPLIKVVAKMKENKYGSALVVKNGKLAGIFTVVDALTALCDILAREKQ